MFFQWQNRIRTSNDRELIRWDQDYGKIEGDIQRKYGRLPLRTGYFKKGKKSACQSS